MRRIALAAGAILALGLAGTQPSFARYEGPWCMHMTLGMGTVVSRCDMRTYEMCRAEMRSRGGTYCTENPYYYQALKAEPVRRKAKKSKRRH